MQLRGLVLAGRPRAHWLAFGTVGVALSTTLGVAALAGNRGPVPAAGAVVPIASSTAAPTTSPSTSSPSRSTASTLHAASRPTTSPTPRKSTTVIRRATPTASASRPAPPVFTAAPATPTRATSTKAPSPATSSPRPPASTAPTSGYPEQTSADQWLFDRINSDRRTKGLPPLRRDPRLDSSARKHDVAMAQANTLSHQLPDEPRLGVRVTSAGVTWTSCGENVGVYSDVSNGGITAAQAIQAAFMAEGPGGGHYENIMATKFTHVGVSVVYDAKNHKIWVTEDFATE